MSICTLCMYCEISSAHIFPGDLCHVYDICIIRPITCAGCWEDFCVHYSHEYSPWFNDKIAIRYFISNTGIQYLQTITAEYICWAFFKMGLDLLMGCFISRFWSKPCKCGSIFRYCLVLNLYIQILILYGTEDIFKLLWVLSVHSFTASVWKRLKRHCLLMFFYLMFCHQVKSFWNICGLVNMGVHQRFCAMDYVHLLGIVAMSVLRDGF